MKKIHTFAAMFAASIVPLHAATDLTNPLNTYSGNSQENGSGAAQPVFLSGDPLAEPPVPASGLEVSFLAAGFTPAVAFETIFFNSTGVAAPAFPGVTFGANRTGGDGRNYFRTVETDYYTQDFTAFVTVKRSTPTTQSGNPLTDDRRSVYFGLGTGARNGGGANPDSGTLNVAAYVELQNGFPNASRRFANGTSTTQANSNGQYGFTPMTTVSDNSMRLRMVWDSAARTQTFSFDYGYDPNPITNPGLVFTADQTLPVTTVSLAMANQWVGGKRASIFFGGDRSVVFTDLVIDVTQPAAPPVPTGLAVASVGDRVVNLTWSSFAIPGTTFKVYRSTTPNDPAATAIATGLTATSFTDDAVANPGNAPVNGTTYYYTVTQSNTVAVAPESAKSNEIPATPVAGAVAPEGLVARNAGDNVVVVDWNDLIAPFDTYKVYRAGAVEGPFVEIGEVIPDMVGDDSSYVDTEVLTGSTYFYQVRSTKGVEVSAPSATSAAVTPKAIEVSVDFNANTVNSGRGVLGAGPGTTWNNDGGDSVPSDKFNDTMGVATALGLAGGSNFGVFGGAATGTHVGGDPATLAANFDLMQDYRFSNGGTIREYTFSGLAPSRKYDLYLFGYGGSADQNAAFDVGGVVKQTRNPVGLTALTENRHYVTFSFVTGDDGTFLFRWSAPGNLGLVDAEPGLGTGLNGFQLVENASAVLQPGNLFASSNSQSAVDLDWIAVDGADSYEIFRSTTSSADYSQIGTSVTALYSDTTAVPGTTYYYVVKAVDGLLKSFTSAEASGVRVPIIVDTDLDGLSDADEALIGTDPNDPADFFVAKSSSVTLNAGNYDVSFVINGAQGNYVIERSTTLLGGSWTEVGSTVTWTWTNGVQDNLNLSATGLTPAPGGKEFFRAKGVAPLPAN